MTLQLIAESKTERVWQDTETNAFSITRAEQMTYQMPVPIVLDEAEVAVYVRAARDLVKLAIERVGGTVAAGATDSWVESDLTGIRWLVVRRAYWPAD